MNTHKSMFHFTQTWNYLDTNVHNLNKFWFIHRFRMPLIQKTTTTWNITVSITQMSFSTVMWKWQVLYQSYTPTVERCRNCTKQEYLYQFIELNVFSTETVDEKYQVYLFSCVSRTPGSFTDPLSNKLIGMFDKANKNKVKTMCSNFYTDLVNPHKGTNDFINTVYRKALFCSS